MAVTSAIEWTDATWNPVTGCDEVSPGCDHCYAKTFAERWRGTPGHYFENGFDVQLRPDKLTLPLTWRKGKKIFVNSMSDLFHKDVPDDYIAKVFAVMALTPQHTYQVLTKRHGRMQSLLGSETFRGNVLVEIHRQKWAGNVDVTAWMWPLRNVWLGVSVEDQKRADLRIPALIGTPAAVRFLSCEPLLGPVDLSRWLGIEFYDSFGWGVEMFAALAGNVGPARGLHWVIVGGESGPGARPMAPAWARSLRDQCVAADVPYLFKQWGAWSPTGATGIGSPKPSSMFVGPPVDEFGSGEEIVRTSKHAAGRELDGRTWDQYPALIPTP